MSSRPYRKAPLRNRDTSSEPEATQRIEHVWDPEPFLQQTEKLSGGESNQYRGGTSETMCKGLKVYQEVSMWTLDSRDGEGCPIG